MHFASDGHLWVSDRLTSRMIKYDPEGRLVAVEVKRRGDIDGVEQLARYVERLRTDRSLGEVRGVFVAQAIRPQAKVLAEARGLSYVEVDYDELRGMRPDDLRLF